MRATAHPQGHESGSYPVQGQGQHEHVIAQGVLHARLPQPALHIALAVHLLPQLLQFLRADFTQPASRHRRDQAPELTARVLRAQRAS